MLTKPSNNKIRSSNHTHGKPFFSRKVGLADIFEASYSTQPTSDNAPYTGNASGFLQSSPNGGGCTRIELQNLSIGPLRRPETGLRAQITNRSELARSPSRSLVPEIGSQLEQNTKQCWRYLTSVIACIIILQTLLAIALGGVPGGGYLSALGVSVILGCIS